jgi:hypothetical protein
MALRGKAALAMWWDMASNMRKDFEDWHSHEHFPERLAIEGFQRASRWREVGGGESIFVMYELDSYDTLSSSQYLAHLNSPTPWSRQMMPHHRNMVRGQCHVLESRGGGIGHHALTIRFSTSSADDEALRATLRTVFAQLTSRPGLVGAHLLRHQAPAIPPTEEQRIRGLADKAVDWVLIVCGYDAETLRVLSDCELGNSALSAMGISTDSFRAIYELSHSATLADTL